MERGGGPNKARLPPAKSAAAYSAPRVVLGLLPKALYAESDGSPVIDFELAHEE